MNSESTVYHKRRHAARTTDEYLFHQLVPYLGSPLHLILEALESTGTLKREDGRAPILPISLLVLVWCRV